MWQRSVFWPALAVITLLGAVLRFWGFNSLPPGLWYDEALVSRLAMAISESHVAPVYFETDFGGIHPLLIYTTIVARWITDNHPLAIRYGIAGLGVLSVPVLFLSVRAMFRLDGEFIRQGTIGGMLAALISAFLFPLLLLNRVGVEVTMPTLGAAMVFWMLSDGLRTGHSRYFLLLGLTLGVSLYSYQSARFLPIAVAVACLWVLVTSTGRKRLLPRLTLGAITALVVYLPLLLYFARHPSAFVSRAGAASYNTLGPSAGSVPLAVLANTLRTIAGLSVSGFGDALARHNIPGRPFFDPFLSVLFWLGLTVILPSPSRRSSAILLTWAGVMLLPVILTDGAPTFTRMMGAMPALVGICSVGALLLFDLVAAKSARLAYAVLAAGLSLSLATNVYDYFWRWASDPRLFDAFQVGDWQAATLARDQSRDHDVYLPSNLLDGSRPTFDVLLPIDSVRAIPGPDCLVYPNRPSRQTTFIIDSLNDDQTLGRLEELYPTGSEGKPILHQPEPFPLFQVFVVPAEAEPAALPNQVNAVLGSEVRLAGYSIGPADLRPGDSLAVVLYWEALADRLSDYTVLVHLFAPGNENVPPAAQSDGPPCGGLHPTGRWAAGERVVDQHVLVLPQDYAEARAVIAVGMYSPSSLTRLPIAGSDLLMNGDRLRLTEIRVIP